MQPRSGDLHLFGPLTNDLVDNLQETTTWSKLSPPDYRQFTLISFTTGSKPWGSQWDKCLNICGDYVEVWYYHLISTCNRSQNKVLSLYSKFLLMFTICATLQQRKRCESNARPSRGKFNASWNQQWQKLRQIIHPRSYISFQPRLKKGCVWICYDTFPITSISDKVSSNNIFCSMITR